jgi:hypothetical protein
MFNYLLYKVLYAINYYKLLTLVPQTPKRTSSRGTCRGHPGHNPRTPSPSSQSNAYAGTPAPRTAKVRRTGAWT